MRIVRWRGAGLVALVAWVVMVVALPLEVGAQEADPDAARREVHDQLAAVGQQVDATRASDEEVSAALDAAGDDVRHQQSVVEDAERAVASAEARLATTRAGLERTRTARERAARELREAALDAYVHPPMDRWIDDLFSVEPPQSELRAALSRSVVGSTADALDRLRAAGEDLLRAEADASAAELAAHRGHAEAEIRLSELQLAQDNQEQLLADIGTRLDRLLGEAAGLASRDADLAAQITQRQQALAAQAAAAEAAADQARQRGSAGTPQVLAYRSSGDITLATVRGIVVNADIAAQLAQLLAAADGDGVSLDGGGWRSPDEQVALRMEHCGTSDYAIWEMPSWECSPPVARPGSSMHEQGLAVDFTSGGDLIRSRSDPAFVWLDGNAARFGFYNLPSEPWHWSTTGS